MEPGGLYSCSAQLSLSASAAKSRFLNLLLRCPIRERDLWSLVVTWRHPRHGEGVMVIQVLCAAGFPQCTEHHFHWLLEPVAVGFSSARAMRMLGEEELPSLGVPGKL